MAESLRDRGSRKHILDLASNSERLRIAVGELLSGTGMVLAAPDHRRPFGRADEAAWRELELEDYLETHPVAGRSPLPQNWWITHQTNRSKRPTWDLIAHLRTERGGPGLLLVEAKAHVAELAEKDRKTPPNPDSPRSLRNDDQIRGNIADAEGRLNKTHRTRAGRFILSADSHYQLANRLTYSVKLATLGYHVALVYLGFLGDTYFDDRLRDERHWQRVVGGYLQGVAPQTFPETRAVFDGGGSLQMLVRGLPIAGPSSRSAA